MCVSETGASACFDIGKVWLWCLHKDLLKAGGPPFTSFAKGNKFHCKPSLETGECGWGIKKIVRVGVARAFSFGGIGPAEKW